MRSSRRAGAFRRHLAAALPHYAGKPFRRRSADALPGSPRGRGIAHMTYIHAFWLQRFNTSFEQVCHRLTTLQRPEHARRAVLHAARRQRRQRLPSASSGTFPFSKSGGTLPLVERPLHLRHAHRLLKQVTNRPDGSRYFSIAQMVCRPVAPHPHGAAALRHRPGCGTVTRIKAGLCRRYGSRQR